VNGDAGPRGPADDGLSDDEHARRPRNLAVFVLLTLLGIAIFAALGIWQVQRRTWKLDLIDRVEHRVHAAPIAAPGPAAWPSIKAADDEYKAVRVSGRFENDRETLVTATTEQGAGYWVLTPLETGDGFIVLVNRGFVPPKRREPATRSAGQIKGETTVTGLIRMTEPKGGFLRANVPSADHWYSRDVAAIARAHGLANVAPYFVDADSAPNPGGLPIGGLTVIHFYNNHLIYALTWFALALMLAITLARVLREERRGRFGN
jgi:surfeit locus 1 family protein